MDSPAGGARGLDLGLVGPGPGKLLAYLSLFGSEGRNCPRRCDSYGAHVFSRAGGGRRVVLVRAGTGWTTQCFDYNEVM
jgi:hypothetical protein